MATNSSSNRTKQFAISISAARDKKTWAHEKVLRDNEYLAMKEAEGKGLSCKDCVEYSPRRYDAICKQWDKLAKPYCICTKFEERKQPK